MAHRPRRAMPEQDAHLRARQLRARSTSGCTEQLAMLEAERCLQCKKPDCIDGCPVAGQHPALHRPAGARATCAARPTRCSTTTPCPASPAGSARRRRQCEGVCLRGKKGEPVAIGALERFVADWARPHHDEPPPRAAGARAARRVAIVGSGPAGLTAAGELAKHGHDGDGLRGLPRARRRAHLRHPRVPAAQGHRPGRGRPAARSRASRSSPTRSSARPTRSPSCASGSTRSSSPSAPACRCSWTSRARTSRASTRPTST